MPGALSGPSWEGLRGKASDRLPWPPRKARVGVAGAPPLGHLWLSSTAWVLPPAPASILTGVFCCLPGVYTLQAPEQCCSENRKSRRLKPTQIPCTGRDNGLSLASLKALPRLLSMTDLAESPRSGGKRSLTPFWMRSYWQIHTLCSLRIGPGSLGGPPQYWDPFN